MDIKLLHLNYRILIEELKLTTEQKHGNVDETSEGMRFLEEQAQRCLTLQLLAVSHSSCIKVETQGTTRNTRGQWNSTEETFLQLYSCHITYNHCNL